MSCRVMFALYHGDEFVAVGTARELAELEGVKEDSIRWYASPAARRRREGTARPRCCVVVRLGREDG